MSLYEFKLLPEATQWEMLNLAVFLLQRHDSQFSYELFQLEGFYVEITIDILVGTRISMKSFNSINQLEPYLNQIPISL